MNLNDTLTSSKVILILMIMAREIVSAPFYIIATLFKLNPIPEVRWIGKITTIFQGFAFPMIVLGWTLGTYLAYATLVCGAVSGLVYARDSCFRK
jgi:phosphatidylglycerophosphate synthase